MTNQSSVHQQYQPRCYEAYEFDDLQEDFSQFLEEAKHHANETKLSSSSVHPDESRPGRSGSEKEKKMKDKKSWKSSLLSWLNLKAERKSKHHGEHTSNSESKASGSGRRRKQGHVSGPIYNCGNGPDVKQWSTKSGPLTSLFRTREREEERNSSNTNIPYVTLQQNSPPAVLHNYYGPLYMVT